MKHPVPRASAASSRWRRAQATAEYAIVLAILMSSLAIMLLFKQTFSEYADRVISIMASDYP